MKAMIGIARALLAPALIAAAAAGTGAQAQPFDPASLREAVREGRTEVLVLGSPHLAEAGDGFDTAWLEPLLTALERFRPDAIVTETLSGEALHGLAAYDEVYPGVADMFAATRLRLAREAGTRLHLSMPGAEAEARRMLAAWPAAPTAGQRRRLAGLFVAAGDLNSALIQWLRLPETERTATDGVGEEAAAYLARMSGSRNESISIAVRLAVRLGLERLHAMDDQDDADLFFSAAEAVTEAERSPALAAARARRPLPTFPAMASPESVLAVFRAHNGDEAARRDAEHQWLARIEAGERQDVHRRRIAAWEARNLRMAANIREASAPHPGRRILVLVGSAHKAYLEAYLRPMADVRIVPAAEVIGAAE